MTVARLIVLRIGTCASFASLKLREERQDKCGALPEQVLALTRTGACAGDDDAVSDWIRTESRRSSWSRWVIIEPRFSPAQSSEPTDERLPAGRGVGEGQLAHVATCPGHKPRPRSRDWRSGINVWSQPQSVSRTAMRQRCVRKTVVGEEKQDLSRSQISRRRLTMTSRLWLSVRVMTARARPPSRRTAGAPRTAMRRRFSRMCRCSAARRPSGVVCCRRL
jgi:hypothetical protein